MPTATYSYVYFPAGKHTRHPHAASGPGGFTLIKSYPGGSYQTNDEFFASQQPPSQLVSGTMYNFAYMNISGGLASAGGAPLGVSSLDYTTPPSTGVFFGTAPITVLVVYVPPSGGPGGSGATIDAFDETTGKLMDDNFVSVAPDSGGALTTSGNLYGYVDTTTAETITAQSTTSPTGANFSRWVKLGPPAVPNSNAALSVSKGQSPSALAFYDAPPPPPAAQTACEDLAENVQKLILDKGPFLTLAQWTNVKASLQKCAAEGYLTHARVNSLIQQYDAMVASKNNPPPPIKP